MHRRILCIPYVHLQYAHGGEVTYTDPATGQKVDYKGKSKRLYTGSTVDLKARVAQHRTSFNPSTKPFTNKKTGETKSIQQLNDAKKKRSTLAAHVWEVRAHNISPTVEWLIQQRSTVYGPGDHWCGICLGETTLICFADPDTSLNKRTELRQGCRHRWKFKLTNHHRPPSHVPPAAALRAPVPNTLNNQINP